jgi:PAS domain S-box-containing protein
MNVLRDSGLESLGQVEWGTHVCQFFDTPQDLLAVVPRYITAGLQNNEMCVWVIGGPVDERAVLDALEEYCGNVSAYRVSGQLQLPSYQEVYAAESLADQQRIIEGWAEKLDKALRAGYDGLRITGNPFWLRSRQEWEAFAAYEAAVHRALHGKRVTALCTYSLDAASAHDVLDVLDTHHGALVYRDGKGEVLQCAQDIRMHAALAKAHEELRLHEQILNHLNEGVALVRARDAAFVYANPMFEKMFGYDTGELTGRPVSIVNAPTEKTPEETAAMIIEALQEQEAWRGEVYNRKKDGTTFWCWASVSTFQHAEHGTVWVAVHTDITEQKATDAKRQAAEAALKKAHDGLECRVAERTKELAAANTQLSEKIADLETFHDVVVGRELKMMDLEKENAELRQELADCRERLAVG